MTGFTLLSVAQINVPLPNAPMQVTRLERDASSGTALQETSFWLNLENALNKILIKRNSPEVELTLEVLKAGKRFHATVSFDSDTGEGAVQSTVDFPSTMVVCELG